LIENLGGPATPAVGWAAGIERLAMLCDAPPVERPLITVIPDEPEAEAAALEIVSALRRVGMVVDFAYRGNAKRRFELATKRGARGRLVVTKGSANAIPSRQGHIIRINEPGSFDQADTGLIDGVLKALESSYEVVRHERAEIGMAVDAVLQPKNII
jgi:histidyl-tRNA synthetase